MTLKAILSPPNAILFVFDPTNRDVVIPPYIDGELTASNKTCVSVGTQADVDGDTEVSLTAVAVTPPDFHQVFAGTVMTPGGKIAVVTSEFNRVLELEVPKDQVSIVIWADDLCSPGRVVINIKSSVLS